MANGTLTDEVIELVADHLEETAVATRSINGKVVGTFLGGAIFGIAVGFYFGYRYNREKIYAEAFEVSERELDEIREAFRSRTTERPLVVAPKPELDQIIEERQYAPREEGSDEDLSTRPLPPPVPIAPDTPVFGTVKAEEVKTEEVKAEEVAKDKNEGWNYQVERARRIPDHPYIIHQDEYNQNETDYTQIAYTYYEGDNVLTEMDDTVINDIDDVVGLNNLTRFGHGADDSNVLYIRNQKLELEMEICRSWGSYEQEVQGLEHSDESFERMHRRRDVRSDDDEES